jgi:hypothetical protein
VQTLDDEIESATECADSASIALEPVSTPATALITATIMLAPPATRTVRLVSPPPLPWLRTSDSLLAPGRFACGFLGHRWRLPSSRAISQRPA